MIKRFLYWSYRLFYVIKHFVIRRFTTGGQLVLFGLVASAIVGVDTNQTLAYQAFTFLLSLLIVSVVFSVRFHARFAANRILPRFGTVGEKLFYRIRIQNMSPKPQRDLVLFENVETPVPTFEEFLESKEPGGETRNRLDRALGYYLWLWLISRKQVKMTDGKPLPMLLPNEEGEVSIEIVPSQRGRLQFTGFTIARPDPLGLFNAFIHIPVQQSIIVLPKRYVLPAVHLGGSRRYHSGGVALASSVGDSEEFMSMRDYRPGDPLRRIHWKSWAKIGKPIVKEYEDEYFVRHALVLDTFSKTVQSEILEEAVSVTASFACSIQTQESLLDLLFVGSESYCFTFGRGLSHTDKALEILASVRACKDKPFSSLPPMVMERSVLFSSCICIFLSWDEERKEFVERMKAIGVPILALVITAADTPHHPDSGSATDGPSGFHRLEVGMIQKGLAEI
jgi:uncharacterized protein (DUF58 family)